MIFAGFWQNFAGFRHQTELKSRKIRSARRSLGNLRQEASPRANQERPRAAPKLPRRAQGRAKRVQLAARTVPEELQEAFRGASETIPALRKPKKSSVKSPLWRESLEKRIRCDFSSILEARAQTRQCKKRVKTCGFPMFFVGRVIFEKISAGQGKRMKKYWKSAVGGRKIN